MKKTLLLFLLFYSSVIVAQNGPFCIEKSSRNSYSATGDSSLSFYKTVAENNNGKILLFKIRSANSFYSVPAVAKTDLSGNIVWTRSFISPDNQFTIYQFDAIVSHDNRICVVCIVEPAGSGSEWRMMVLWLDKDGAVQSQNAYSIPNTADRGLTLPVYVNLSIAEAGDGNIIISSGHTLNSTGDKVAMLTNIDAAGNIRWHKIFKGQTGPYSPIGVVSYNDVLILQGLSVRPGYPSSTILNSTKLSLLTGEIINGKSYVEQSDRGGGGSAYSSIILTSDLKIKTLAAWRIPYYYQIYFSFTMDTSLAMLRSTTFHTPSSALSYFPVSSALNKKGMVLIKTMGGIVPGNNGYFTSDINDNLFQQKRIDNSSSSETYTGGSSNDVVFDNSDSIYVYWNAKKNNKGIVSWIKTPVYNTAGLCTARDTSFILTNDYGMSIFNWQLTDVPGSYLNSIAFTIDHFSSTVTKELICEKITGFCDPIKIKKLDTVCSITQPVSITVNKNPECRGPLLFLFDTLQVRTWQQPNDTTLLLEFDKSWDGYIYVTSSFCPLVKDSVRLVVNAPLPGINIGKDTNLCKGDSLVLFAGNGFASYTWQNNSNSSSFIVKDAGVYYATVTDNCGRYYSDTIRVNMIDKKIDLGTDISICNKESIGLKVKGNFSVYEWGPLYNISNTNLSMVTVHPENSTNYYVTARTAEGCAVKDTILITVKDCPQIFYIPSAFTPDNNGKNDLFRPIFMAPVEEYQFSIYNRWGERIFYSVNVSGGWDGKVKGIPQDGNTFIWICHYKFYGQPAVLKKGSFVLIR